MYLLLYSINPLIVTTTAMRSKSKSFLVRKNGLIGVCGQVIFGCGYRPWVLLMTFNPPADSPTRSLLHSCLPQPGFDMSWARAAKWECLYHLHTLLSSVRRNFAAKLDFTGGWLLDCIFTCFYSSLLSEASVCGFLSFLSQPTFCKGGTRRSPRLENL